MPVSRTTLCVFSLWTAWGRKAEYPQKTQRTPSPTDAHQNIEYTNTRTLTFEPTTFLLGGSSVLSLLKVWEILVWFAFVRKGLDKHETWKNQTKKTFNSLFWMSLNKRFCSTCLLFLPVVQLREFWKPSDKEHFVWTKIHVFVIMFTFDLVSFGFTL